MKYGFKRLAALLALGTLLTGCGGGAFSWDPDPVTGITASNLALGQTATLHLSGNALNNAITITSDKCSNMNPGSIGSPYDRIATCTVTATGPINFIVSSSSGHEVYRTTLNVPEPVSEIRAVGTPTFGQEAVFELVGAPQNNALTVTADKCTLTLDPVSTNATRKARCTPLQPGPITLTAKATVNFSTLTLLSKTLDTADPTELMVSSLKYNQTATLLVPTASQGTNVSVSATKCTNIAVAAAVYANSRVVTCTVNGTGSIAFTATSGSQNFSKTLTVAEPQVTVKTSLGDFVIELNPTAAPLTVQNFLRHVASYYTNTIFHRVEGPSLQNSNYVVQAGGYTTGLVAKTPLVTSLTLETSATSPKNLRYTVGMARVTGFNSATSQFYVNLRDNPGFDYVSSTSPGYAVFGTVVSGTNVIDTIAGKPTHTVTTYGVNNTQSDTPNEPVEDITILSATQTQ